MKNILVIFLCCCCAAAGASVREPVATSQHFEFYSDFDFNLHDALLAAGVERKFGRGELFAAGDEQACFEGLAPSAQSGWDLAVDYYSRIISPHAFNDRQQFLLRLDLADIGEPDERERQFLDIAAGFRAAAALAYRSCRWHAQDAANRRWIAAVSTLLDEHEAAIATRLATLYQEPWPGQPIQVDVVGTVSWAGANSFFARDHAGHLMISSGSQGHEALETVFHEASHGFMLGNDALPRALREAAAQLGVDAPEGLWHVVLFVTTGETVRETLVAAGQPDYEPMIIEIYGRSSWGQYEDSMNAIWPAYLRGTLDAQEAMIALVSEIKAAGHLPGR